jgi:hypothetical protein
MAEYRIWQTVIVDWDSGRYATLGPSEDDESWDQQIDAELKSGRDIHCFHHDIADTSGLAHWAEQHRLTETDVLHLMAVS